MCASGHMLCRIPRTDLTCSSHHSVLENIRRAAACAHLHTLGGCSKAQPDTSNYDQPLLNPSSRVIASNSEYAEHNLSGTLQAALESFADFAELFFTALQVS